MKCLQAPGTLTHINRLARIAGRVWAPVAERHGAPAWKGTRVVSKPPIVAVGLLSRTELERLGAVFTNCIPMPEGDLFADLLAELDQIEVEPLSAAVVLRPLLNP